MVIDCIQLRQNTWVLASWKWADFNAMYMTSKMYEHALTNSIFVTHA